MKKNIINNLMLVIGILSLIVFAIPNHKVNAKEGYDDNRNSFETQEKEDEDDSLRRDKDSSEKDDSDKNDLREKTENQKIGFGLGNIFRDKKDDDNDERKEGLYKKIHEFAKHRYETITERLTKLQTRVQTRIDKVKGEGKDTTLAQNALTTSVTKLTEAKSFIASAKALIDANVNVVPMSQTIKDQIKDYFKKAKDSLKASYEALKDSVKQLKIVAGGSSSPSSNDNSND